MLISIKTALAASLFIQQTFGFWILNIDKKPSNYLSWKWMNMNYYEIPDLYNYERKKFLWKPACGCSRGDKELYLNEPMSQCQSGCDGMNPKAFTVLRTTSDVQSQVLARMEVGDIYRPCGMVYDNTNFTSYACGSDVNEQLAKITKLNQDVKNVDATSNFWVVTIDKDTEYGYDNQLTVDYFNFNNGSVNSDSKSRCLTSIHLPDDHYFDAATVQEVDLACDKVNDPLNFIGTGNTLLRLENKSSKESYPCFPVEHKSRFSIFACGKHVPIVSGGTNPSASASTTTTSTTKSTTGNPTSTTAPKCITGYCGKKRGTGPTGACCSTSDDCIDTCNSNGKCGISDMTGEPKTGCLA